MSVKKAVIPCAGLGTRFLPLTKVYAKELLPIVDVPALYYILEELEASGIEETLIVISPQKRQLKRLFCANKALNRSLIARGKAEEYALANRRWNMRIRFIEQREMDGNGNALLLAREFVGDEAFAVAFGDDIMYGEKPVTAQLIEAYETTGASVVGCQRMPEDVARKCAVMIEGERLCEGVAAVRGLIEKPEGELPSDLTSLGRFVLTPEVFEAIEHTSPRDGEVYLTDAIDLLARRGANVCSCEFSACRYDIGDKLGYLKAVTEFALRDKNLSEQYAEYLKSLTEKI